MTARRLAALALIAPLAGCAGPYDGCDSVETTFSLKNEAGEPASSFGPGETITFEAIVTNRGALPIMLAWDTGNGCSPVYFEVEDAAGTVVWDGPCVPNVICDCAAAEAPLRPGEQQVVRYDWDQSSYAGGEHTAATVDISQCAPALDAAAEFTLVR